MDDRYFIVKRGGFTRRIAGSAGRGHIESAETSGEALDPQGDVYEQMFRLGYIRVLETDTELQVDAPKKPTAAQTEALVNRATGNGSGERLKVVFNEPDFIRSRSKKR